MGKADRNKKQTARERIAAQQREAHDAEVRRRAVIIGAVTLVLLAVVAIVIDSLLNVKPTSSAAPGGVALPAAVQSKVASVPVSTLTAVGTGTADTSAIRPVNGAPLTSAGKPEMIYIGAEWCPYCAAERWAMAVALSRFGSFSPLRGVHSSSSDVYPNTATLTFYRSTYTSPYLVFTPIENEDVNHNLLVKPTPVQQALWSRYEPPGDSYPFIDIGNRFVSAATYDPAVLANMNWSQIAAALHDPSSPVAQGAVGSANLFTAAICKMTGNKPASVCTTAPVSTVASKILGTTPSPHAAPADARPSGESVAFPS
jgi:thiol-disulfide isomerase/thioredoxin